MFVTAHTENISDIIVRWSVPEVSKSSKIQKFLLQWRLNNKPNNITEIFLNGNITKYHIHGKLNLT